MNRQRGDSGYGDGFEKTTWQPDAAAKACTGCLSSFGLLRRRHHCRRCGQVYCQSCSAFEASLPCHGYPLEKVRVCTPCDAVAKREVMLHRRHLPMLRRGDQFVKYGMIRQRDVNLLFDADSMNLRFV